MSLAMLDNLAFRTARSQVRNLASEYDELIIRRHGAMDCFDCESFLQLGIEAFHWLTRADESMRKAVFSGKREFDSALADALEAFYKLWLRPCGDAEKWIADQESRGYKVSNAEDFRCCVKEVKAIVDASQELAGELTAIRDKAIEANRSGQCTEWEVEEPAQPAIQ